MTTLQRCVCVFLLFEQHAVQTATFQTNGLRSVRLYTHTHRYNVAVACISLRHVATPVKYNHNSIENFAILSS